MALFDWNTGLPWDTLSNMERLLDDLGRSLTNLQGRTLIRGRSSPAMNVWANDDEVAVRCEVPGVAPDTIGVTMMGDFLTVQGSRREGDAGEQPDKEPAAQGSFAFSRSVQMPCRVEPDSTRARCRNGVLTITLRRPESEKPRHVAVQAG